MVLFSCLPGKLKNNTQEHIPQLKTWKMSLITTLKTSLESHATNTMQKNTS